MADRAGVLSLSGAEAGDWVLLGTADELWPVTDEYFTQHYEPVPAKPD